MNLLFMFLPIATSNMVATSLAKQVRTFDQAVDVSVVYLMLRTLIFDGQGHAKRIFYSV